VKVAGHRRGASLEYAGEWIYFKGASEADVHFLGLGVRLGLLSAEARAPDKRACLRWTCSECPRLEKCATGASREALGPLAGWVQAALYVHDRLSCSRGKCSACPLDLCSSPTSRSAALRARQSRSREP